MFKNFYFHEILFVLLVSLFLSFFFFVKRPSEDGRRKDRHKERSKDRTGDRRYSTTNSTIVTDVEVIEKEMKIQAADMPMHMQRKALQITSQAVAIYTT